MGDNDNTVPTAVVSPALVVSDSVAVDGSASATVDGSGSEDDDGHALTYSWSYAGSVPARAGTNVGLSGASTAVLTAQSLAAGRHTLRLTVTDTRGAQDTADSVVWVPGFSPGVTVSGSAADSCGSGDVCRVSFGVAGTPWSSEDGVTSTSITVWLNVQPSDLSAPGFSSSAAVHLDAVAVSGTAIGRGIDVESQVFVPVNVFDLASLEGFNMTATVEVLANAEYSNDAVREVRSLHSIVLTREARYAVRSDWGQCSSSCGIGKQERDVVCENRLGETLSMGQCSGQKKPESERSCVAVCPGEVSNNWYWHGSCMWF